MIAENMDKPAVRVRHEDLEPLDGQSQRGYNPPVIPNYKSECFVCDAGILLVGRNQKTFRLQREDRCVNCGQLYIYEDIHEMRDIDETGSLRSKEYHIASQLMEDS
jgi:hypothetical protein